MREKSLGELVFKYRLSGLCSERIEENLWIVKDESVRMD